MSDQEATKGKTESNPLNGVANGGKTNPADQMLTSSGDQIAERVEYHADLILRASGGGLRHYSMSRTRHAILSAALAMYEEAYRAGAKFADEHNRRPVAQPNYTALGLGSAEEAEGMN